MYGTGRTSEKGKFSLLFDTNFWQVTSGNRRDGRHVARVPGFPAGNSRPIFFLLLLLLYGPPSAGHCRFSFFMAHRTRPRGWRPERRRFEARNCRRALIGSSVYYTQKEVAMTYPGIRKSWLCDYALVRVMESDDSGGIFYKKRRRRKKSIYYRAKCASGLLLHFSLFPRTKRQTRFHPWSFSFIYSAAVVVVAISFIIIYSSALLCHTLCFALLFYFMFFSGVARSVGQRMGINRCRRESFATEVLSAAAD